MEKVNTPHVQEHSERSSWQQEIETLFQTVFYQTLIKRLLFSLAGLRAVEWGMDWTFSGMPFLLQGFSNSLKYGVIWLFLLEFSLKFLGRGSSFWLYKKDVIGVFGTLIAAFSSEITWIFVRLIPLFLFSRTAAFAPFSEQPSSANTEEPSSVSSVEEEANDSLFKKSKSSCWPLLSLGLGLSYFFSVVAFGLFGKLKIIQFSTLEKSIETMGYLIKSVMTHPFGFLSSDVFIFKTFAKVPNLMLFCQFFSLILFFILLNAVLLIGLRLADGIINKK